MESRLQHCSRVMSPRRAATGVLMPEATTNCAARSSSPLPLTMHCAVCKVLCRCNLLIFEIKAFQSVILISTMPFQTGSPRCADMRVLNILAGIKTAGEKTQGANVARHQGLPATVYPQSVDSSRAENIDCALQSLSDRIACCDDNTAADSGCMQPCTCDFTA